VKPRTKGTNLKEGGTRYRCFHTFHFSVYNLRNHERRVRISKEGICSRVVNIGRGRDLTCANHPGVPVEFRPSPSSLRIPWAPWDPSGIQSAPISFLACVPGLVHRVPWGCKKGVTMLPYQIAQAATQPAQLRIANGTYNSYNSLSIFCVPNSVLLDATNGLAFSQDYLVAQVVGYKGRS
jgi:hypothetical protein